MINNINAFLHQYYNIKKFDRKIRSRDSIPNRASDRHKQLNIASGEETLYNELKNIRCSLLCKAVIRPTLFTAFFQIILTIAIPKPCYDPQKKEVGLPFDFPSRQSTVVLVLAKYIITDKLTIVNTNFCFF